MEGLRREMTEVSSAKAAQRQEMQQQLERERLGREAEERRNKELGEA